LSAWTTPGLVLALAGAMPSGAVAAPDSLAAVDSLAAADSLAAPPAPPPWEPDRDADSLARFRLDRSVDVEARSFRLGIDAAAPPGATSLAPLLRLSPGVRTREMSQGATAETFDLSGAGSGSSALLHRGSSVALPGTSGPHSHEIVLSEIDGFAIVRGGASALYGPDAVGGAVITSRRDPLPDELLARATAEEGVDDWQRASFQAARRIGDSAAFFVTTESRRFAGFFPGTKEVDRHFAATVAGRGPAGLEGRAGYRRFEGDGRQGGFDPETIRSVLTKRDDLHARVFRPTADGGALLELELVRERLETGVLGPDPITRLFSVPMARLTADLPARAGLLATARAEVRRVRVEWEEEGRLQRFLQGAGALRVTRRRDATRLTATLRGDAEEGRPLLLQARAEGEWSRGRLALFAVASRGERLPDRDAARPDDAEVHLGAEAGARIATGPVLWRGVAFATGVSDARREPTLEEIRARRAVLDPPEGDVEIRGATAGGETTPFPFPYLGVLGDLRLASSVTRLAAENATTGVRLPRRARFTWTGEGSLERRLFGGELLARLRGRLTHLGDRVDGAGAAVEDAWSTDVLLEGEVGDAVFFYRFHDLLERADEIEPGVRFPGFSRMWGVTWRFVG